MVNTDNAISIHAPREGGDLGVILVCLMRYISIHAPREGGDKKLWSIHAFFLGISIHAPREGGDLTHSGIRLQD